MSEEMKLNELAKENKVNNAIFKAFLERQRPRAITDVHQFQHKLRKDGVDVDKKKMSDILSKLQKLGIGTLVKGKENKPDRFYWNYDIRSVGAAALRPHENHLTKLEEPVQPPAHVSEQTEETPKRHINAPARSPGKASVSFYHLQNGVRIKMSIPEGLSEEEIASIPDLLREALSFD